MSEALQLNMLWGDWFALFIHYATLSLLAVGGAISTMPDMHRFLVDQQHWLTETQFNASIAIAQAAPGPNVLFVALMGWHVGLNNGGTLPALFGTIIAMVGIITPSSVLTYMTARWGHENRERRGVRAFKQGMAPIVIALLISSGWILASAGNEPTRNWPLWLTSATVTLLVWKTRLHLLWLLGAGGLLGWMGWI